MILNINKILKYVMQKSIEMKIYFICFHKIYGNIFYLFDSLIIHIDVLFCFNSMML
jgi:hypothetical protein